MKPLALVLLLLLLVVALRHREPDRAVMRPRYEDDDGIQPSDPYPASFVS